MKGFIERIEEENVYVMFEDGSTKVFNRSLFPQNITIDMNVIYQDDQLKTFKVDEEIKQQVDEITKRIFVPFKDRKKK